MDRKVRWGILGAGTIAHKFASAMKIMQDGKLVAVASRGMDKANQFGDKYGIPNRYGSYDELVRDPEIDVIYVATLNPFHKEHVILCLNSGKAVLCEKPMAVNVNEVEAMVKCARNKKLFLMEAMWTRFLPVIIKVREWLDQGVIGDIRLLSADFCYRTDIAPKGRLFNPKLGGGALLDIGVYVISFASMIFGSQPKRISSMAHIGETGVDEQTAMIFGYDEGQMGVLKCAIRTNTRHEARIYGTKGAIYIPNFWTATSAVLVVGGKETERIQIPLDANGFCYEIQEVNRCIVEGKLESDIMPLDESIAIIKTMDKVRNQWSF